ARAGYCLGNQKQLGLAWVLYADDNSARLISNQGGGVPVGSQPQLSSWVNSWGDLAGSYHNGGAEFAFADGHAEYKKWQDAYNPATGSGTVQPVLQISRTGFPDPKGKDLLWFSLR